jgi:hypothetical protein
VRRKGRGVCIKSTEKCPPFQSPTSQIDHPPFGKVHFSCLFPIIFTRGIIT